MSCFQNYTDRDIAHLIAQYPLAWVRADRGEASLLPLTARFNEAGKLVKLAGHMARRNPLYRQLVEDPQAQILFTGPAGYVSPEHAQRRDWGPTWNYAALKVNASVLFRESATAELVDELITHCESGRPNPWTAAELGPRYYGMLDAIIGFEACVESASATFKLAQDESDEVYQTLAHRHPDPALRQWMMKMNAHRA